MSLARNTLVQSSLTFASRILGLVRDVLLIAESPRRFESVRIVAAPDGQGGADIRAAWTQQEPFPFSWAVTREDRILAQAALTPDAPSGEIRITLPAAEYWSPDNPALYELRLDPDVLREVDDSVRQIVEALGDQVSLNNFVFRSENIDCHIVPCILFNPYQHLL